MSFTKTNAWIGIILVTLILTSSLMLFGTSLKSKSGIVLTDESEEYIDNYAGYSSDEGITDFTGDNSDVKNSNSLTSDNETGEQSSTDVLAGFNWKATRLGRIWSLFEFIYNIPTFILLTLQLPVAAFNHIINVTTYVTAAILIFLALKKVT